MQYFDCLALTESLVSQTGCVLLWVGWWGLWDCHIFPVARNAGLTEDCVYFADWSEATDSGNWQVLKNAKFE